MTPIVDGLEAEFSDQIFFLRLNALDGAEGEAAFNRLALPGHPSFVIFTPDNQEQERIFGVVEAEVLRTVLEKVVEAG
jgi:thiol:disulfide interchange protein